MNLVVYFDKILYYHIFQVHLYLVRKAGKFSILLVGTLHKNIFEKNRTLKSETLQGKWNKNAKFVGQSFFGSCMPKMFLIQNAPLCIEPFEFLHEFKKVNFSILRNIHPG